MVAAIETLAFQSSTSEHLRRGQILWVSGAGGHGCWFHYTNGGYAQLVGFAKFGAAPGAGRGPKRSD